MSSTPADFVLRGFDCSDKAKDPCFVVSGSMTAYVLGIDRATVQAQMRIAIYRAMQSGAIAATISRVNGVALLDESLNLATLPPTSTPSPQFTIPLSSAPTTMTRTAAPTTEAPSSVPSTRTVEPTPFPSATPSTPAPSTQGPTSLRPTIATGVPTLETTTAADAPATKPPTAKFPTSKPHAETTTAVPTRLSHPPSTSIGNETEHATIEPTESATDAFVVVEGEQKSAFEKVPVWAWVVMALSVCVCCSYAADEDEDEAGVNHQTFREQERLSRAIPDQLDKSRDSMHDSEAFSSVEYVRRLYRQ